MNIISYVHTNVYKEYFIDYFITENENEPPPEDNADNTDGSEDVDKKKELKKYLLLKKLIQIKFDINNNKIIDDKENNELIAKINLIIDFYDTFEYKELVKYLKQMFNNSK